MKKLIVISIALISIAGLNGCKRVVLRHDHHRPVVVDSRHYHRQQDVHVIRHDASPVRHPARVHPRRNSPSGHVKKRVLVKNKKEMVVEPPTTRGRSHGRPEPQQKRHQSSSRRDGKHHQTEYRKKRQNDKQKRRNSDRVQSHRDPREKHNRGRKERKDQHARRR